MFYSDGSIQSGKSPPVGRSLQLVNKEQFIAEYEQERNLYSLPNPNQIKNLNEIRAVSDYSGSDMYG